MEKSCAATLLAPGVAQELLEWLAEALGLGWPKPDRSSLRSRSCGCGGGIAGGGGMWCTWCTSRGGCGKGVVGGGGTSINCSETLLFGSTIEPSVVFRAEGSVGKSVPKASMTWPRMQRVFETFSKLKMGIITRLRGCSLQTISRSKQRTYNIQIDIIYRIIWYDISFCEGLSKSQKLNSTRN